MQDAFTTALERWPVDGMPRNPGAWIVTTARNRAIDRIRRERTLERKTELLARLEELPDEDEDMSTIPTTASRSSSRAATRRWQPKRASR